MTPPLSFAKYRILVIGDSMLDVYINCSVKRISPEAPVPVALVQKRESVLGGAANVACNLACLGSRVSLVGIGGNDPSGERLQDLLSKQGIEFGLVLSNDRPTTCKTRVTAFGQQLIRLDTEYPGEVSTPVLEDLLAEIHRRLPGISVVILSDYDKGLFRRIPNGDSLAMHVIDYCHRQGLPVLVDPKGADWGRYAHADCVTPNTRELSQAAGCDSDDFRALCDSAQCLMQRHDISRILLTRGEKGMALLERGSQPSVIPSESREVADVSGAGDTVIAVLAAGLSAGMDWISASRMANIAAGVVVGKAGTSPIELSELRVALQSVEHPRRRPLSRIDAKLFTLASLRPVVDLWHRKGKKVVFTNGCFDLLHQGHVRLIEEAASQGDKLIVAVNSDNSVRRLKGSNRPVQKQETRAAVMAALEGVDAVILFDEDTPRLLIESLTPDVLVKGSDYNIDDIVGAEHVIGHGGRVHLAHFVEGFSTTKIIQSIL